ncbi:MAG: Crp/Fnr family transcriptional regulator [Syntrophales bacterium]
MDLVDEMRRLKLFEGVPVEKLQMLAEHARYRKYRAGEMFIGETDAVHAFYVVISGQIKLYKSSPEGKEQTLYLLRPGDPFGMCTAFAIDTFPANATALEESGILLIPGQAMETVAMREPRLLVNIIQILSDRLKESMTLIESLSLKEIPERLASFLLHDLTGHETEELNRLESAPERSSRDVLRGKREKTSGVVSLKDLQLTITQRELAKILGATPEALSRAIRKMTNAGILVMDGRSIRILDREALEELAEGE